MSRPPDHTWGHGLQPKAQGQRRRAYRLTVCVCRAYRTRLQATSTDLFFGAGDKQGRPRYASNGPEVIDCLRQHTSPAGLSLKHSSEFTPFPDQPRIQVGSPYRGGTAGARKQANEEVESPEARHRARLQNHRHWFSVCWQKKMGATAGFISGRLRRRGDD